jgi:hypothetical protein
MPFVPPAEDLGARRDVVLNHRSIIWVGVITTRFLSRASTMSRFCAGGRAASPISTPKEDLLCHRSVRGRQSDIGERQEVIEPVLDDFYHDVEIEPLVLVYQDVAEPDYRPKGRRHRLIDQPGALQQREAVLAVLGQPQLPDLDQVIGNVDADLAGTLYVQANRVLPEIILLEGISPFMA